MSVLARYVSGQILLRLLIILFAILAFEISFDLLERADRILAAHDGDYRAVFRYAALRVPGLLVDLLPAATLLAALLVMGNLLRHRELVASWNMGLSPAWLMGKLLPLAAILGLVQAVVGEVALPPSAKALAAMGFGDRREGVLTANAEGPLWIRQGQDVVRIVPAGSGNARSGSSRCAFQRPGKGACSGASRARRAGLGHRCAHQIRCRAHQSSCGSPCSCSCSCPGSCSGTCKGSGEEARSHSGSRAPQSCG